MPRLMVLNSERFAELKSFSLKNFTFLPEPEEKTHNEGLIERDYEQSCPEDPLYNVLSLRRGQSECYLEDQAEISQAYQYFIEEPTSPNTTNLHAPQSQLCHSQMSFHYLGSCEESEGESKNLLSTSNEAPVKEKEQVSSQAKTSTKNVTKNMGKLLFKFIWKNRNSLKKQVAASEEEWDAFIACIRIWKK